MEAFLRLPLFFLLLCAYGDAFLFQCKPGYSLHKMKSYFIAGQRDRVFFGFGCSFASQDGGRELLIPALEVKPSSDDLRK
uniref:Uncharacterized protein n=1 Tax=Plectus sambesii TaxID=2011161 RepID=A0A914VGK3_9BILA